MCYKHLAQLRISSNSLEVYRNKMPTTLNKYQLRQMNNSSDMNKRKMSLQKITTNITSQSL